MNQSQKKHFIVAGIVLLTLLVVIYLVASKPAPPVKPKQETVWTVDTETLQKVDRAPELNLIGEVQSTQRVNITSRVNSTVTATPYLAGTSFRAGEIILTLDAVEVEASLLQRQADVEELKAIIAEARVRHEADQQSLATEKTLLELTRKAYDRQQRLMANKVTSEERSDSALSALHQQELAVTNRELSVNNFANTLAQLNARLKRAEAQLTLARLDMQQTTLEAPFDGQVIALHVAAGERIRTGEPLLEVVASDSIEVRAQIPDRWVPQIRRILQQSQAADAYALVYGDKVDMTLTRMAAAASSSTGGIDVYLKPVTAVSLPLDKPVDLHVSLPEQENAFTVPLSAIYGDSRIYVVDEESRLQAATINRLGRYLDDAGRERVIFQSPELQAGMTVVTTQLPKAVTGLKVKSRSAAQEAAEMPADQPETDTQVETETAGDKQA